MRVLILTPSPCIYGREPPSSCTGIDPNRHGAPTIPRHVSSVSQWDPWAVTTRSADLAGRPTVGWARLARSSVKWLLGGTLCHIYGFGLVLSRFGSSGGPVDPREHV